MRSAWGTGISPEAETGVKPSQQLIRTCRPVFSRERQRCPGREKWPLGLVLALLALAELLLTGCGLLGLTAPELVSVGRKGTASIGASGPVTLSFIEPVQRESVEASFSIDPPVDGHFTWEGAGGQVVSFWPASPLVQGQRYTISLKSGVRGQSGRILRSPLSWVVEVRLAEVVYLSPSQAPEIWRVSSDGTSHSKLTATGGNVYDFDVSPSGDQVVYSVKNVQQGYDLWEVGSLGKNPALLLPCGTDWCTGADYSPDGTQIAYSRRINSGLPGREPAPPQIWLLERTTLSTGRLVVDPNVGGSEPDWSPDGRYLAFYDGLEGGVRIQDVAARTGFLTPSEEGSGIEWSPDSRSLLFTQVELADELAYNSVYEVDVLTRQTRLVLGDADAPADYSVPDWAPGGERAAVGWRTAGGSSNKQLWLVGLNGSVGNGEPRAITVDETYSHASYHWDPGGRLLVFQRLEVIGAVSPPQVAVWNRLDGKTVQLAEDAFYPQWLP